MMTNNNRDTRSTQGGTNTDEETRQPGARMGNDDVGQQRDNSSSQGGQSQRSGGNDRSNN